MHEDKAQGVVSRIRWPDRTTKVISFQSGVTGDPGKRVSSSIMLSLMPPSFVCTHHLELSFSIPSSKLLLILQRPSLNALFQTSTDHSLSSYIYCTHA